MTTQEIADKFVQHLQAGKFMDAIDDFYADDIVSHEMPGIPNERTEGKAAVRNKSAEWEASVQSINSAEVSDAQVAGNFFSISLKMDVTFKERGQMNIEEIAVYEVKNDKIVSDRFFYSMDM
ncbi:SnoaL-like protein [Mucilaginibacter yixingensis]|uniref:SnoaL-like protein n=1 Tax=Mucilaginibacter yixingensis TaxID=1295612 RepID=A0A2T5J8A3_9SPHI|nr:nuclear transport factor 2 family protein [Mucilaginibacter yixingensis]PTQ95680.1 SnoaL-like protein [Mucilaginibacter yixingensis]